MLSGPDRVPEVELDPLPRAETIEDVIENFDRIIAWAIEDKNGIGYFATVYKRATVSIKAKIDDAKAGKGGYFDDHVRMEYFDVVFANRYFDALNAYFHPSPYGAPTHTWQWCFDGHEYDPPDAPIILQHMMTAVNAHVNLDLGIAAAEVVRKFNVPIDDLAGDFQKINVVLANEVETFLATLAGFSTGWAAIRAALPCEDQILNHILRIFRNLAWTYAKYVNAQAGERRLRGAIGVQDSWSCVLGSYYLHVNDAVDTLVRYIRAGEDPDVAGNIRVLDGQPRNPG